MLTRVGPQRPLHILVKDMRDNGIEATVLEVAQVLARMQRTGVIERDMAGPTYLVLFTTRCKACAVLLECEQKILSVPLVGLEGNRSAAVLHAKYHKCNIRYGYDEFVMGNGKVYRITTPPGIPGCHRPTGHNQKSN
jgi:hypothetical protein